MNYVYMLKRSDLSRPGRLSVSLKFVMYFVKGRNGDEFNKRFYYFVCFTFQGLGKS